MPEQIKKLKEFDYDHTLIVHNVPIDSLPIVVDAQHPYPQPPPKPPLSEKQLEANRRNALKSTGPRTEEGKARAKLNALRHGLTSNTTVMTGSQREAHDLFFAGFLAHYNPVGAVEENLVQRIVENSWRLNRSGAMEENMYALGHPDVTCLAERSFETPGEADPELAIALAHARSFMAQPKTLQLLTLYEQRIQRSIRHDKHDLSEVQAERKAAHQKALEQAILLAELAEAEGHDYNPAEDANLAENGFVFSCAQIKAQLEY